MRIGKIESRKVPKLLKFCLATLVAFNCSGAGSCQTVDERYDTQLETCVKLRHKEVISGVECFENLRKSNPNKGSTYLFLARSYRELGRLNEAEEAINIFVYAYETDASGQSVKCEILRDKRDFQEALLACDKAMSLEPDNSDHKRTIASLYEAQGEIDRAENWYKRALSNNPNDKNALVELGRLYEKDGKLDKAIGTYERLLELEFEFQDKLKEGIKKLKEMREIELNKEKELDTSKSKAKAAGKQ